MSWIWMIIIGAAAGWIAEKLLKRDDSLLINVLVGIAGSLVGGTLLGMVGIDWGGTLFGRLVTAAAGAVLLLWVINAIRKRS